MTEVAYFVARWRSNHEGVRTVLARRERSKLVVCVNDYPVRVVKVADPRSVTPIEYPVARCARKMLAFGKNGNIKKAARKLLKLALRA